VLSPATLSILTATFTDFQARNRALSIWTAVAVGGGAVGAIAGGVLTGLLSWRWIFFVNIPVGAGLLAAAWFRLPRTQTGASGWTSAQVGGALAAGAVLFGVFALVEARVARAPVVPFSVFRSRLVSAGNALSFLSFLPVMAIWFFLTLYLQDVRGYTALQAGLVFLPMSLAVAAGTQVGFKVIGRADTRLLFLTGGLTAAGGAAWLAQLTPSGGLWAVIVPACLAMAGGGLMFAPIMAAATAGLPPGQGGLASRQVGGALGLAILASVGAAHAGTQHGVGHPALTAGFSAAYGVAAGIFAATATIGSLILPRQVSTPKSGEGAQEDGEGNQ
jgi:hypothetical protein